MNKYNVGIEHIILIKYHTNILSFDIQLKNTINLRD